MNSKFLPSILFIVYGLLLTVLAGVVAKDINNDDLSDQFVGCQQTVLSLGSMSLAFGLVLYVLNLNGLINESRKLTLVYLGLGALITVSLLVCSSVMMKELYNLKLHKENIGNATGFLIAISVLSLVLHGFVVFRMKGNSSSVNTSCGMY